MTELHYPGQELQAVAQATHWKSYLCAQLRPHLRGDVLEVGAGLGSATLAFHHAGLKSWTSLEPDPNLIAKLRENIAGSTLRDKIHAVPGVLQDLEPSARFDTILYFDVLEHIENDAQELDTALSHLREGGRLIVLSPAHQWLYSSFDKAIGHFRRYTARTLHAAVPPGMQLECMRYLDSVGMIASLANLFFLKQSTPSLYQVLFWDRVLTRISRVLDPMLAHAVGKNILGVWSKPASEQKSAA